MPDGGKQLCFLCVWVLVWILGLTFSWVYTLKFSSDEESTSDIAYAGAILYTFSISKLLKEASNSGLKEWKTLAALVAFVGGFVLPIIAAIFLAVGAAKTSDTSGTVIASLAAAFAFLSVPLNCMIWGAVLDAV